MNAAGDSCWKTVRLGEIAEFRNGVNYTKDSFGTGIKVINVKNFQDRIKPRVDELDEINPDGAVSDRDYLENNDILFVRSNGNRELIGRSLFLDGVEAPLTHSAFTIRVRFINEEVYPRFYAYLLRSNIIRDVLSSHGGGTNISNLNQSILNNLEVPLPPLDTQVEIASILSAYDDLIENNRRRIEILEEMARNIYREWFVHFRFPGHENVPLVDSPLGPIPEGWEVKELGELATLHRKSLTPAKQPQEQYAHYSLPAFDDSQLPVIESGESIRSNKYMMPEQCVLLAKLNPRIPRVWLVLNGPSEPAIASTEFMVLAPEQPATIEFLFSHCRSDEFMGTLAGVAGGTSTSHQRVKPDHVLASEIAVPDSDLMSTYTHAVSPLLKLSTQLVERNEVLSKTRDLLLPKLVAGDLTATEHRGSAQEYEHE